MELEELIKMKGEWVGVWKMSVGGHEGPISEYIKLEETDVEGCLSYIGKSRIDFPGRPTLHNELGYMHTNEMGLLLSRGSYEILEWNEANKRYEQVASSPDSRNMVRKVTWFNEISRGHHKMSWWGFMPKGADPRYPATTGGTVRSGHPDQSIGV